MAQAISSRGQVARRASTPAMAPMKAMKAGAKAMSQGALAQALSESTDLKKAVCAKAVKSLAEIGTQQVKTVGKFVLPGLCRIKTRLKPATKAGERAMFGKVVMVKAKPAKTVVKAFPVSALKKAF